VRASGTAILDEPTLVDWGRRIGAETAPPLVLALTGPLGAGKSVLARAVARGAGVAGPVPSPTFNLLLRYTTADADIVHVDLYRIRDPAELWELGWQEIGADDEIVIVEWPERAGDHLPAPRWDVRLEPLPGRPGLRRLTVRPVGEAPALPAMPAEVGS
jgi:tRNA threonylcarbamoyladenosine biosynthesis protein TsaE